MTVAVLVVLLVTIYWALIMCPSLNNYHSKHLRWVMASPLDRGRDWGSERLNNTPTANQMSGLQQTCALPCISQLEHKVEHAQCLQVGTWCQGGHGDSQREKALQLLGGKGRTQSTYCRHCTYRSGVVTPGEVAAVKVTWWRPLLTSAIQ